MSKLTHTIACLLSVVAVLQMGSACERPDPACAFACSDQMACPSDYSCQDDGWCKRTGVSPEFRCSEQSILPIDASAADAPMDAQVSEAALNTGED